jgi:hypothetical protein
LIFTALVDRLKEKREDMSEATIMNDKEKLRFIIQDVLKIQQKEITQKLEIQKNVISEIMSPKSKRNLKKYHIYAVALAYDIPIEIFEDSNIDSKSKIIFILAQSKKLLASEKINFNSRIKFQNLIGNWYLYTHSNTIDLEQEMRSKHSLVKEEMLYIDINFNIEDKDRNSGVLQIFDNQSIITLKNTETKDIVLYTFDNNRLSCDTFFFNKIAKLEHSNREVLSFGFFSKKRLESQQVNQILGDIKDTQIRANCRMLDKISFCNNPKECNQ